jgi:hypothetical protein
MAVSGLPELDVARVRRWCADTSPDHLRDQVRIECQVADRHLTVVDSRPPRVGTDREWIATPVARLRYTKSTGLWELYWRDSNGRFRVYEQLAPSPRVEDLLAELDRDPTALFWG